MMTKSNYNYNSVGLNYYTSHRRSVTKHDLVSDLVAANADCAFPQYRGICVFFHLEVKLLAIHITEWLCSTTKTTTVLEIAEWLCSTTETTIVLEIDFNFFFTYPNVIGCCTRHSKTGTNAKHLLRWWLYIYISKCYKRSRLLPAILVSFISANDNFWIGWHHLKYMRKLTVAPVPVHCPLCLMSSDPDIGNHTDEADQNHKSLAKVSARFVTFRCYKNIEIYTKNYLEDYSINEVLEMVRECPKMYSWVHKHML